MRVHCELGLAGWDPAADSGPRLVRGASARTDLERSAAYRAYAARLRDCERYLSAPGQREQRAAS